ncbi:hypothetical protein FGG08_003542 [Glutinoglossum americanum]|uniref:Uncharacterized protein n=1 Tax=Glutinoglossum americanum TaxID=1670608 RepID=A0A9P8I419_9PEZI|nr:hypothetical protein FGG08_003542 [Glutinoglossum americanum]
MSSNDLNYLKQYRLSQGEIAQPPTTTLGHHSQRHGPSSSTPYYQQPPTANVSYPTEYHHQTYAQNRPLDSSNSPSYSRHWCNSMPVSNTSGRALETGAAGNIDVTVEQDTISRRNSAPLPYDTSALGSLAYASGLQYSEAGSGRIPQDGTNVPSTREYGSVNQSTTTQQPQSQYRSPILNLATAATDVINGYQQPRSNSANSSNRQSVSSYSHRSPPTPSESISPTTNTPYLQTLNTTQTLPHSKTASYYRPNVGNTSSFENRDTSDVLSMVPEAYQPNRNQQAYQYGYVQTQNRTSSRSLIQRQAHAQARVYSHAQSQGQASDTQTRQANQRFRGTPPAISHTQGQSTTQTYHQAETSNEQTKLVPNLANQNLHVPREVPQPNTSSYQSQQRQQRDQMVAHSPINGQNPNTSSQTLHQRQPSSLMAKGQPNRQISNSESSEVIEPTLYTRRYQCLGERTSSSTQPNTAQHVQRSQSPSPNTPATVNPSHIYNPYHEYRRQIEAAEAAEAVEAEQAKQGALRVSGPATSASQPQQLHPIANKSSLDQRSNNPGAHNTIGGSIGKPVNGIGEVRTPEILDEKELEEVKKRQMMEKMLLLMREDPTLFNHAMEELKNASPHPMAPSQTEQQQATYSTPSRDSLSGPPRKTIKKANAPARTCIPNKKAANSKAMEKVQAGPSGATTTPSGSTPAPGPHLQFPGSPLPLSGSMPQPSGPTHSLLSRSTVHKVPGSAITQHLGPGQLQQASSIPPQSSGPTLHQLSGPTATQHSGYPHPQQPRSTQSPPSESVQIAPFGSITAQSFQSVYPQPLRASTGTPPVRPASVWPESKREALGNNAVKFLTSIPENSGKMITPQQIRAILDRNPNYVELCETIESMGFRLDRVRFPKALPAAVPDTHPTGPRQGGGPPSANGSTASVHNSTEIPSLADDDRRGQHSTQAVVEAIGLNTAIWNNGVDHLSGSIIAPARPHIPSDGMPTPAGLPAKRGRGRPRKDKGLTQSKSDAKSGYSRNKDDNTALNAMQNDSGNAQRSISEHHQQISLIYSKSKDIRQGNHDVGRFSDLDGFHHTAAHFTPLNGLRTQTSTAENTSGLESGLLPLPQRRERKGHELHNEYSQRASGIVAASQTVNTAVDGQLVDPNKLIDSDKSIIDKSVRGDASTSLSGHVPSRGRPLKGASHLQPTNFSPSTLLTPPLPQEESSHIGGFSIANIEQLAQDPYDLEPELPDHLVYLERCRRVDHNQSQATDPPATEFATREVSMGLPSRADLAVSTPKNTTARTRHKASRLELAFRTRPHHRDLAEKKLTYNPKKISYDLLIAVGKHPTTRPLNAHIERIKQKAGYVRGRVKLSAIRWDAVDPSVPSCELSNGRAKTTEKTDMNDKDVPKAMRRTRRRFTKNEEAAKNKNLQNRNGSAGGLPTEGASPIPSVTNPLKRKARNSGSSSPPFNGSILGSGAPISNEETQQQNRPSPVDPLRAIVQSSNFELRGPVTTPACPSKLRNEITPSSAVNRPVNIPSVVIPSRSPSVRAEYTPIDTDQSSNVFMANFSPPDPGPSGHMVFKYGGQLGPGDQERFLSDTEGRRLMLPSSFTNFRGNIIGSTASSSTGTESCRLPAFLTHEHPADPNISPKMRTKRIAATAAYERALKRFRAAGPTVLVPPSCTFDKDEARRATLESEDLYMIVDGSYDPIQMILDKDKAPQSKTSDEVES